VLAGVFAALLGACGPGTIGEDDARFGASGNPTSDPADLDDPFPQDDATCPSAAAVVSASNGWQSAAASQAAFDSLELELMARPEVTNLDALIAVGAHDIGDFSDAAISVRFADDGLIDARDGSGYDKDVSVSYEAGVWYTIVISADIANRTYDVEVGRCGEVRQPLITGAAFRADAGVNDRLTTWAAWSSRSAKLDLSTPSWSTAGSCAPATCPSLGLECGDPSNGCDGSLSCGGCAVGEACSAGACVDVSTPPPGGGELPGGVAGTCTPNASIGAACICEGAEYTEGYCCDEGFSYSTCGMTELYVVPGGTGARDGSDWANALDGLPGSLMRDHLYWIAAGSYGTSRRTFDDPESGSLGITIRKATAAMHGTETGWDPTFGDGQANFGRLEFRSSRYTMDGGEPNGIKSTVTSLVNGDLVFVEASAGRVVLRHMELDGGTKKSGTSQTAGVCSALQVKGDGVVVDRCDLHHAADDGIEIVSADNFSLFNSKIRNLPACGTDGVNCDGPCFNGHSDGIEMRSSNNVQIVGNMVYDVLSTGAMIAKDEGNGPSTGLLLHNNVFYTPAVGQVAYLADLISPRIYNNVVWGRKQGSRYGGIAFGPDVTDLEFYNNIVTNIRFSSGYSASKHHLDYNQFGVLDSNEYPGSANDQVGDPLFNGIPLSGDAADHTPSDLMLSEFSLSPSSLCIDQGVTAGPQWDIVGVSRPQGAAQDMGAFEASP